MISAPFALAVLLAAQAATQTVAAPADDSQALLKVRRVFVDRLVGGETEPAPTLQTRLRSN